MMLEIGGGSGVVRTGAGIGTGVTAAVGVATGVEVAVGVTADAT